MTTWRRDSCKSKARRYENHPARNFNFPIIFAMKAGGNVCTSQNQCECAWTTHRKLYEQVKGRKASRWLVLSLLFMSFFVVFINSILEIIFIIRTLFFFSIFFLLFKLYSFLFQPLFPHSLPTRCLQPASAFPNSSLTCRRLFS